MNEKHIMADILLEEDNEDDILLTLEAFEECKLKTEISVAKRDKKTTRNQ